MARRLPRPSVNWRGARLYGDEGGRPGQPCLHAPRDAVGTGLLRLRAIGEVVETADPGPHERLGPSSLAPGSRSGPLRGVGLSGGASSRAASAAISRARHIASAYGMPDELTI